MKEALQNGAWDESCTGYALSAPRTLLWGTAHLLWSGDEDLYVPNTQWTSSAPSHHPLQPFSRVFYPQ